MSISDVVFIFSFLPIVIFIYYISRVRLRKYILLLFSLLFYACGAVEYLLLLIVCMCLNIVLGYNIARNRDKKILSSGLVIFGIVFNVSILVYYKYFDVALEAAGHLFGREIIKRNIGLPLGISFFTFKAISYLVDIYMNRIHEYGDPIEAALYMSFFPQIQSGPLSRYEDMIVCNAGCIIDKEICFDDISEGIYQFIIGFQKKMLLANVLSNITIETFSASPEYMSAGYAWLGAVCYSLQLYYDFSGYSDMAVGISRMFGYRCPHNFDYPYWADSVSVFWRKWHITLGAWFRDYVYIPLGGSRSCGEVKWKTYRNLFIVWALTSIWHGVSWNFMFWGMGYFVAISLEKMTGWPFEIKSKTGKIIYRMSMLLFINFQWVIFRAEGFRKGVQYILNMFGAVSNPIADARALFLLKDYVFFILIGVMLCFPIVPWAEKKIQQRNKIKELWGAFAVVIHVLLFIWSVSMAVAGRNNPFAYANF